MKGLIVSLLGLATLAFGSCFGFSNCQYSCDNCEEDHADGVCDDCGGESNVSQYTESLELCIRCASESHGGYGSDCDGCFDGCF